MDYKFTEKLKILKEKYQKVKSQSQHSEIKADDPNAAGVSVMVSAIENVNLKRVETDDSNLYAGNQYIDQEKKLILQQTIQLNHRSASKKHYSSPKISGLNQSNTLQTNLKEPEEE